MSRYISRPALLLAAILAAAVSAPVLAGVDLRTATLSADPEAMTLNLGLSAGVQPRVFMLDGPVRVVVDLPDTRRIAGLRLPAADGLVVAVRGAPRERGTYRLVMELRQPIHASPQVSARVTPEGYRLQIRLGNAPAMLSEMPPTTPGAASAVRTIQPAHNPGPNGRDIIVAIDAGHGGEDPGASGPAGTHEKDITLAIARALATRLNARGGMRAVLTRDADRLIDLRGRMDRARNAHADLFVSIHADSVRDRSIAGASVYTLSYRGASSEAARWLADRENAAVLKGGVSLADVNPNLASVLLDASQSANMGASVEAAEQVLSALDGVGAVRKRIVQHAGFMVLKSPDVPSMLVETAYISNPSEERNLRSAAYQARLAAAIESGLVAYFQRHPPDGTRYADARRSGGDGSEPAIALARSGGP